MGACIGALGGLGMVLLIELLGARFLSRMGLLRREVRFAAISTAVTAFLAVVRSAECLMANEALRWLPDGKLYLLGLFGAVALYAADARRDKHARLTDGQIACVLSVGMMLLQWILLWLGSCIAEGCIQGEFFAEVYRCFSKAGDVPHYVSIAQNGYTAVGENANEIVFFPLFPLLMRVLMCAGFDPVAAGMAISNVCLFGANAVLSLWLSEKYSRRSAVWAVLLLNLFPAGMFLIHCMTESLFILLSAFCLYAIEKRRWLQVGLWGLLAALTRMHGVGLLVPAVIVACEDWSNEGRLNPKAVLALFIGAGLVLYLCLNKAIYGSFFAFSAFQAAPPWYNSAGWISENLTTQYNVGLENPELAIIIYRPQIFLYFAALAVFFCAYKKRMPLHLIAYGGAWVFMSYLHGWMISGVRYMLGCLPLFILTALSDKRRAQIALLIVEAGISVAFHAMYMFGYAIM